LIARIIRGKSLYIPSPRHPWLELARRCHHSFDIATPSAALLPIEDHIGNRNLPNLSLTGSLKRNRPNQVITLINGLAEFVSPKKSQNDQSNDKGVAQFVPCGWQFSNPQLPHYCFVPHGW
jgi:hypothetical protein